MSLIRKSCRQGKLGGVDVCINVRDERSTKMKFSILTKATVANTENDEVRTNEQNAILAELGYDFDSYYLIQFPNGGFPFRGRLEVTTLASAMQDLAIKEGVDLVRFANGRVGFVAYYGKHRESMEIILDMEKLRINGGFREIAILDDIDYVIRESNEEYQCFTFFDTEENACTWCENLGCWVN